jgi:riboflavin synthase
MFTGLIEETGKIAAVSRSRGALRLQIAASLVLSDLAVDDSISVDGICLTVVAISADKFDVELVEETVRKTTADLFQVGKSINLERCLRPTDRMGGHIVQGHVDATARVLSIRGQEGGVLLTIRLPEHLAKYVISEGSIAINGVSLTVARLRGAEVTITLIPHTLQKTTLGNLAPGDTVNIEVDVLSKYVERILMSSPDRRISYARLKEYGFNVQDNH